MLEQLSALLPYAFWIISSVFVALLLALMQNLTAAVCSSVITITAHKKLIYETRHNSADVNCRLMELGHVLVECSY